MDFKQIQELIKLINESNIGEVTIEQKEFKITIRQKEEPVQTIMSAPMQAPNFMQQAPQQAFDQAALQPAGQQEAGSQDKTKSGEAGIPSNAVTIKSPMIGTFYRKPAPDKPTFVEVGDVVSPGKVVCVIEAMKLFNEIESEV